MQQRPRLVVLTDFSPASRAAYGPAAELASRLGGSLELVHVLPQVLPVAPGAAPTTPPLTTGEMETIAARELEAERARFPADVAVTTRALHGRGVARTALPYAREIGADLVVLATHGRTGLRRVLLGSVAEQVLRESDLPLLVLPAELSETEAPARDERDAARGPAQRCQSRR